ncbi:PREDICTED: zinc-finger homeodomain protein 2 isoform X2 [Tarenaya hassleriana]|uniref:zinc-finger homeodomain protein 2 isoform X1 n=1 Tax=Tarenaya hassleriana TaxID=28532 RepID=UPI0008FD3207|nr:PREDICTED: zinc-finger homeodomain protein 2 isoform X1 [Tarenaya hassleriana]XP_019057687.1 PREDICTED: zinc-finger homeodomain protein 2 isoform X2 [Tarenaya hassleriana]
MDFEEQAEEMEMSGVPHGGYDSLSNSSSGRPRMAGEGATSSGGGAVRYRECLKNHAVSIGGHAVDGCGEFMPSGEEGTLESLKCAACGCHRNFHRKETDTTANATANANAVFHHQFPPYYRPPPPGYLHHPHRPFALPPVSVAAADEDDASNPSSSGGGGGGTSRKRFRTKFTAEQKEKMLWFAEKLGWRIQRHDDAAVEQFCAETGVKRNVLKIWMHNNKNTLGKKP